MGIGTYGVIRPSDVSVDDISIYYNYTPNRETLNNDIVLIENSEDLLSQLTLPSSDDNYISNNENILEGLYNLTLPATIFNQIGIYTIYIKPKTINIDIVDCNVLSSAPTVKGIVVNVGDLPEALKTDNALQGYKVEYINSDGTKLRNTVRYVVTSYKVTPIAENLGDSNRKVIRYQFNSSGTLMFLQLTPSSASDVKVNDLPFIGNVGQTILLSNTYFSPVVIEVDLVENTIETISDYLMGDQVKNVQNGIITYYDKNREITKQYDTYDLKDDTTNVPLYQIREVRTNILNSEDFDLVTGD